MESAEDWGIADSGMERGVVLADINRDGWLDLGKRNLEGSNVIYLSRCGEAGWLGGRPPPARDPEHPRGRGARSRSRPATSAGPAPWWPVARAMRRPRRRSSTSGSGDITEVDEIIVTWPDGEISVLPGIDTDQRITITRGILT